LRTFLDQKNPDAARRALAAIWTAITSDRRERAGDRVRFLVDDHQQDARRSIRMTSILLPRNVDGKMPKRAANAF
jgi:hypothetical protein